MRIAKNITARQKLAAFELRFYQFQAWEPKVGDYYTVTRAELVLFQIVGRDDQAGEWIVFSNQYDQEHRFAIEGFTTQGFGPSRLWVPEWIFENYLAEEDEAAQLRRRAELNNYPDEVARIWKQDRDELLETLKQVVGDCRCSIKERFSGHLVGCSVPGALEVIAKVEGRLSS